jgi:O-antigen ligase
MGEINWARWLVYLVVGVPALTWLLFTRNNVLRLLAVLGILMFVEAIFTWRRHFFAIGVGPSVAFVYVALVGLYFQRGRFPSLGTQGFLWVAFLFTALIGLFMGSFGTGLLLLNIKSFQEYYLEGALFFLVGMMAFERDEDVTRFLYRFVTLIGGGMAAFHLLFRVTGWSPPALEHLAAAKGYSVLTGGTFSNPNTLADFYAMTLPMTLLFFLGGGLRGSRRFFLAALLTAMTASLLLAGGRGGILATIVMVGLAFLLSGERLGRTVVISLAGVFAIGSAILAGRYVLPELFRQAFEQLATEGLETERITTWGQFLRMVADHPFGVGLVPENILALGSRYGTNLANAHNIYLNLAVTNGIPGLTVPAGRLAGHG